MKTTERIIKSYKEGNCTVELKEIISHYGIFPGGGLNENKEEELIE